ncbi:hypothetical protein HAX54_001159 [Datura stramonium]|uniref:Uncharacterized protein n=1 Tax=Datura stramonium TaxID=4076 RepID=A0ABS8T1X1_DATST|nr:hypothetical protein [Datura stramonium]
MVLENTCKRKDPPTSFKDDNRQMSTEVLCKNETLLLPSIDEVVDGSKATSSTNGDVDQDQHLKCKNKKVKDQSSEITDLDTIDNEIFFIGDPSSTMPLLELVEQLGFEGASIDMFNRIFDKDGAKSPSCLEISSPPPPAALINEAKITISHVKSSKSFVPPSCLSPLVVSKFKLQETISSLRCLMFPRYGVHYVTG